MTYWLLKSEPSVFGIDALAKVGEAIWDGVRNYQARNHLKTAQIGDPCFFYHSNTSVTGIAGLCKVVGVMVADPTQFDSKSDYYDPKSPKDNPRWHTVKVAFVEKFPRVVTLDELKATFSGEEFIVVRKGNRLSVNPVSEAVAARILKMAKQMASSAGA